MALCAAVLGAQPHPRLSQVGDDSPGVDGLRFVPVQADAAAPEPLVDLALVHVVAPEDLQALQHAGKGVQRGGGGGGGGDLRRRAGRGGGAVGLEQAVLLVLDHMAELQQVHALDGLGAQLGGAVVKHELERAHGVVRGHQAAFVQGVDGKVDAGLGDEERRHLAEGDGALLEPHGLELGHDGLRGGGDERGVVAAEVAPRLDDGEVAHGLDDGPVRVVEVGLGEQDVGAGGG